MKGKITVIGAGSLAFTPNLMADLASSPTFRGFEVTLMDPDDQALKLVKKIADRIVEFKKAELKVEATTDKGEALKDAEFVTITIGVGGVKATRIDGKFAEKYGVYQPVADTVGPGGFSRALRHIPVIVDICRDVEMLCPDALVINETNPLTTLCRAARKVTRAKVIGLCTGILGAHKHIARILGVRDEELTLIAAGLNHFTWIKEVLVKNRDAYPALEQKLTEMKAKAEKEGSPPPQPISNLLLEKFGLLPVPGDSHVAEFLPYFIRPEFDWGGKYGLKRFSKGTIYSDEWREKMMRTAREWSRGYRLDELFRGRLGEYSFATSIMRSIIKSQVRFFEGINVPNEGLIDGLPDKIVVEVPGMTGPIGVRGVQVGELPRGITAILKARAEQQELTVEAALTGDRDLALQALLLDPLTPSIEAAEGMLNDILSIYEQYLPQFKK